jgi:predicted dehydrogenase
MELNEDGPVAVVVGTGFGCRIQVPALRASGFRVRGLVGTDPKRTSARATANGVPQAFVNLDEAIIQTGAEAVAISTPPLTHAQLVLRATELGCHVLCEKPFARDRGEAEAMLAAAQRAGVTHVLGNEFGWEASRNMAARLTSAGAIGEPRFATFVQYTHYAGDPVVDLPDWWFDKSAAGGWLGASGSHLVDWTRSWLGDFESVSGTLTSITGPADGAEDSFTVRFRMKNGIEGVLQQTAGAWGDIGAMTRIAGTKGTVWLDGERIWLADADGTREVPIDTDLLLPPAPPASTDPRQEGAEWQMLAAVELAPYTRLCEEWRRMIEGRPLAGPVPVPTFADGVANMAVLDAIRRSAEKGGAVTVV